MKLNKYLRELGLDEKTWPFDEIRHNQRKKDAGKKYDDRYIEHDGFINAETFNLDFTLACIIYSYLCYFRDNCTQISIPVYFLFQNGKEITTEKAQARWLRVLNQMITGFRLYIQLDELDYGYTDPRYKEIDRKIKLGLRQFAKYFAFLNW